jgi:predicted RNase H-like nuclease (RuvC/YqgF family)
MFLSRVLKGATDMIRAYAIVLIISTAVVWTAGCQEEQASPDVKTARLIAVENRELKAQLQAEIKNRDNEIQNLKDKTKKQDDEIKNLAEQLSQCEKASDAKIEKIQKDMGEQNISFITNLVDKNSELTTEVERLKAELAKAKGEK